MIDASILALARLGASHAERIRDSGWAVETRISVPTLPATSGSRSTISLRPLEQSCREHLAILDAVEAGEIEWPEALLRQHFGARIGNSPRRSARP